MSIAIMTKVWGCELGGPTVKAVAMKLADCAHDDGKSVRPSVKHVARRAEISERSVQSALAHLRGIGLLVRDHKGGGRYAARYHFDLTILDRLYAETQAKWISEDEATPWLDPSDEEPDEGEGGDEGGQGTGAKSAPVKPAKLPKAAKPGTGAKSAPVHGLRGTGAAPAPYPSIEPKQGEQPKPYMTEEAGSALIPFCSIDADALLGQHTPPAAKGWQPAALPPALQGSETLPFPPATLREISRMGVDVVALVERYQQKTKGRRIPSPTGYLMTMAYQALAQKRGVPVGMVRALAAAGGDQAKRAEIVTTDFDLEDLKRRNAEAVRRTRVLQ